MKKITIKRAFSFFMCFLIFCTLFGCANKDDTDNSKIENDVLTPLKTVDATETYSGRQTGTQLYTGFDSTTMKNSNKEIEKEIGANTSKNAKSTRGESVIGSKVKGTTTTANKTTTEKPRPAPNRDNLYGLCYVQYIMQDRVTNEQAATLIKTLGVKSACVWNHATYVMPDYKKVDKKYTQPYHDLYKKLRENGVNQIIAMSHFHYLPDGFAALDPDQWGSTTQVPRRDKSPSSKYTIFLKQYEETWKALSAEFPEVDGWEMGNEMNHNEFLSPYGYSYDKNVKAFTIEEKADITTDMIFAASKGIKAGNPKAITILPPMAPVDGINGEKTLKYLERIYQNIKSGKFGSTKSDDFFEALAWHPYYNSPPGDEWVKRNNEIYAIAQKHGDGDKKVFLTEVGFVDGNSNVMDKKQGQWINDMYKITKEKMPYVESIHYYRMFTDGPETYALFTDPGKTFAAKHKATAYQEMAGGKGNLNMYKK